MLEFDTLSEKDELNGIQMQEFSIHAEETIDAQRHCNSQEAKKSEAMKCIRYLGQFLREPLAESIFGLFNPNIRL